MDSFYISRIIAVFLAAALASLFTWVGMRKPNGVYNRMNKSPLQPPNWVFKFVWPLLYLFIAISWCIAASEFRDDEARLETVDFIFGFALFLNVLWCVMFFSLGFITLSVFILGFIVITAVYSAMYLRKMIIDHGGSRDDHDDCWWIRYFRESTGGSVSNANAVGIAWILYAIWCSFATLLNATVTY